MPRLKSAARAAANHEIATRLVEDPFEVGRMIAVPVNVRHDPIHRMVTRREIDKAQALAAAALRDAHDAVAGNNLRAVDFSRIKVDTSRSTNTSPSDHAIRAVKRLRQAEAVLGWQLYRVLCAVVVHEVAGSSIAELSSARVDRNTVQFQVRSGLEQLAVLWGFAADPRHVRQHASIVASLGERPQWQHDVKDVNIRYQ
jgi:hypothetical protein